MDASDSDQWVLDDRTFDQEMARLQKRAVELSHTQQAERGTYLLGWAERHDRLMDIFEDYKRLMARSRPLGCD